jgi:hypothetical protein
MGAVADEQAGRDNGKKPLHPDNPPYVHCSIGEMKRLINKKVF